MALKAGYYGIKKKILTQLLGLPTDISDIRSEQAVLGAGNFMPDTVNPLTFASTGNVRVETNNDAVSFIAPIDKNTHYWLSTSAGNRFRVALSTTLPANGVNVDVIFSSESVLSKDFDSGNYNYVILLTNIGAIDTSTIKPLLAKFPDTLYAPYAMTNRELTEAVTKQTSAFTDIVEGASVNQGLGGNFIEKNGNVVTAQIGLEGVTATAWSTDICMVPVGFRPSHNIYFKDMTGTANVIGAVLTDGRVRIGENKSNVSLGFNISWSL